MLISYKHNFVFVHNYKVAGTSVKNALKPYGLLNPPHNKLVSQILEIHPLLQEQGKRVVRRLGMPAFHGHDKAVEIKNILGAEQWDKMFSFGYVRNPWDWQVSLYHYMLEFTGHHQHEFIKTLKSFDEYIEWRVHHDLHLQSEFFVDQNRQLIVDFVGKMENVEQDFAKITHTIGLNDVKLPHKNKSQHKPYADYYSNHSRELVQKYFAEDIERFQYSF
jgi:hypothetical protein